jgi:predicted site-specific integrase-resolvase
MSYKVVAKNDRLERFRIFNVSDIGRVREVIADNIEKESTAVLLSAAPELLEALEDMLNTFWEKGYGKKEDYRKAQKAIAKAHGKLPPTPLES